MNIKLIQFLISINENIFFYPRLRKFYNRKNIDQVNATIIFDVGANNGQSIDFFSKVYGNVKIYAFELNPKLYNNLKAKYKRQNLLLFNLGISDSSGQLLLNETITYETSTFEKFNYGSSYLQIKADILGVKKENIMRNKYFVDFIRLKDFIKRVSIKKIDKLKIDTDGHELKCLQSLFIDDTVNIKFIQLKGYNDEMYLSNDKKDQIINLLILNGLNMCNIIKYCFSDFNECIYEK
jgi:FkbM family methyltransferase